MAQIQAGDRFIDNAGVEFITEKPATTGSDWLCRKVNGEGISFYYSASDISRGKIKNQSATPLKMTMELRIGETGCHI